MFFSHIPVADKLDSMGVDLPVVNRPPDCSEFEEIVSDYLSLLETYPIDPISMMVDTSDVKVIETSQLGQFMCDLAGK